jgi:dihydrolipoamide dehydrogenase
MDVFDVVVIGAGPGGYVAAIRAAQLGLSTCLIEKRNALGGACLNVGCIPSKALLESSELYSVMRHSSADHGIDVGEVKLDLARMLSRKEKIVSELTGGIAMLMNKNKVTTVAGLGRLVAPDRVAVQSEDGRREVGAKHIIIATGSESVELPFMPFDGQHVISSTEALCLTRVPEHLLVVGAGAIGLEMGSVWARLGAKVSVIELLPRIVPFADAEMSKALQRSLKKQGLQFHLQCKVTGAKVSGGKVTLGYEDKKGAAQTLEGDHVLVAVGRRPYTDDLGLEALGIQTEKGRIVVDGQLMTNVPNVYAIGDVIEGPMLAHKAEEEGVAVAERIAGQPGHVNYDVIPNIVYTWPELAQVGISQEEAKEQGLEVRVGKFRFVANGRAKTLGDTDGLVKILADVESDQILGAHIVGPRASDMIAELVMAMEFSASSEDVARTCHAHPTLAEVVKEAALAVDNRPLHS